MGVPVIVLRKILVQHNTTACRMERDAGTRCSAFYHFRWKHAINASVGRSSSCGLNESSRRLRATWLPSQSYGVESYKPAHGRSRGAESAQILSTLAVCRSPLCGGSDLTRFFLRVKVGDSVLLACLLE